MIVARVEFDKADEIVVVGLAHIALLAADALRFGPKAAATILEGAAKINKDCPGIGDKLELATCEVLEAFRRGEYS